MVNLIKNELFKIVKQKSTIILTLVLLTIILLGNILDKVYVDSEGNNKNSYFHMGQDNYYRNELENKLQGLDPLVESNKFEYADLKTQIEVIDLVEQYAKNEAWIANYINKELRGVINDIQLAKLNNEDVTILELSYNEKLKVIVENDWKIYSKSILENLKLEKEMVELNIENLKKQNTSESILNEQYVSLYRINLTIELEELRINNNYGYDETKWAARYISDSISYLPEIYRSKLNKSQDNQDEQNDSEQAMVMLEYESVKAGRNYLQSNSASNELVNVFLNMEQVIMVVAVTVAGGIVANEFNKGTIKLLLIRPYKRWKILMAKYISVISVIVILILITFVFQLITGVILFKPSTLYKDTAIFNYTTEKVEMINTYAYSFINAGMISVKILLISTLALLLSVLFKSSALAIALPILGFTIEPLISMFAVSYDLKWLKYFVTLNWNFRNFLFGKNEALFDITLPFAIIVCLVYLVIMLAAMLFVFKRTDVNNQ